MIDIKIITALVYEYLPLAKGALIDNPDESFTLLEIDDSNPEHPHSFYEVCISRRSLKHMVESRVADLSKRHAGLDVERIILFAIENVAHTIQYFDVYKLESPDKHFYTKDYSDFGMPSIRVLLDVSGERLFIRSIHFVKRTKKHRD